MKTPMALSVTSSQREQTSLRFQVPRLPRSNVCSTRDLENPSASVHLKRFSTPSLTLKFLCAGKSNPRKETKTLILADTIMNFELGKLGLPYRLIAWLSGIYAPFGGMPIDMRLAFWPRRREVRTAFERMLSWRPERIIHPTRG